MSADEVYQQVLATSVANASTSMASPSTQAAAQPVPYFRLADLPGELQLMVLRELDPESREARNMAVTRREYRDMAMARYWSVIERDESIRQLLTRPPNEQQLYANLIHELRINGNAFTSNDFANLRFNALEKLEIEQKAPHHGNTLTDISSFIGPRLKTLSVEDSPYSDQQSHLRVANFFPILTRAPGLRKLIFACSTDAGPQDLLDALRTLPRLEELILGRNGIDPNPLRIDHEVLRFVATNPRIKRWSYEGGYTDDLVIQALQGIPSKQGLFLGLSDPIISLSTSVANRLLPRMHLLKTLYLFPNDEGDILDAVSRMPQLENLHFYPMNIRPPPPLTTQRLSRLLSMNLKTLSLVGSNYGYGSDGSAIALDDFSHIFGSHQTLESLELSWQEGTHFYEDLGGVLWRLANAYPHLKTLKLPKASLDPSHFEDCQAASVTAWPSLTSFSVFEVLGPEDPSNHQALLRVYARAIHDFFPSLASLGAEQNQPYVRMIEAEKRRLFD
ncbi:hypothetical protein KCU81_g7213, partial [Aureobasidium melanogenum]